VSGFDAAAAEKPFEQPAVVTRCETLDVLRDEVCFLQGTDAVFYLAQSPWYREFPRSADHLFGVNTFGAIKAAQAAMAAGVRLFCYASSGNVYAPSLDPLAEGHPVRRDDPYALSKLAAEEALALFAGPMAMLAVRLFGLFGPGQRRMLPASLLARIRSGEEIALEPAEGEAGDTEGLVVSFTYVVDAARLLEQLARIALAGRPLPPALNVAGPEPISVRRFSEELGRAVGIEPRLTRAQGLRRFNLIADLALLRSIVRPQYTPLADAIAKTCQDSPGAVGGLDPCP
jgi:nucleoside-diphosphate-sugar epimerase